MVILIPLLFSLSLLPSITPSYAAVFNVHPGDAIGLVATRPNELTEQVKLVLADAAPNDIFGHSVALSADGATILVGASLEDCDSPACGRAHVFRRSGNTWNLEATLALPDPDVPDRGGSLEFFGLSVALSGDGATALVGAPGKDCAPAWDCGAAYVFRRMGTNWTLEAKLIAPDPDYNDDFGFRVALSADGAAALVGAPDKTDEDCVPSSQCGAAYVFGRSGSTWTPESKLILSDYKGGDRLGYSVALSGDGTTALIGAINSGAAYVFGSTGGIWNLKDTLIAPDAGRDYFGWSLALSADGATALIGALLQDCEVGANCGAAYVFARSDGIWTPQAILMPADVAASDEFGYSTALSADGATAVVSAPVKDCAAGVDCGAAYLFQRTGGNWTEVAKLSASDAQERDGFGDKVALSGEGATALVGAPGKDCAAGDSCGAAYLFTSAVQAVTVTIDIKRGSNTAPINPRSNGRIPVAILSHSGFDATTIDSTTIRFGSTGTEAAPIGVAVEDVNRDGRPDLLLHFLVEDSGIQCGDTSASILGETLEGIPIRGSDTLRTVGCSRRVR